MHLGENNAFENPLPGSVFLISFFVLTQVKNNMLLKQQQSKIRSLVHAGVIHEIISDNKRAFSEMTG